MASPSRRELTFDESIIVRQALKVYGKLQLLVDSPDAKRTYELIEKLKSWE